MKIKHILGLRNKVADGLSRTLFYHEDCSEDIHIRETIELLEKEGSQ